VKTPGGCWEGGRGGAERPRNCLGGRGKITSTASKPERPRTGVVKGFFESPVCMGLEIESTGRGREEVVGFPISQN
jgi:hypothetical protein